MGFSQNINEILGFAKISIEFSQKLSRTTQRQQAKIFHCCLIIITEKSFLGLKLLSGFSLTQLHDFLSCLFNVPNQMGLLIGALCLGVKARTPRSFLLWSEVGLDILFNITENILITIYRVFFNKVSMAFLGINLRILYVYNDIKNIHTLFYKMIN